MSGELVDQFRMAVYNDDPGKLTALLGQHPELIEQPVFEFDCPAIVVAASRPKRKALDALLSAGANVNARSRWWAGGFGVLDTSDPEIADYLIQRGAIVDAHAAARLGRFERLKELVEAGPSVVNARGGDGQTPLHFASTVEIAEYLLAHGANIDARDIDHESTPAMYLIDKHPDVVRYLISRGCHTDILMASAVGDVGLVRRILDEDPASVRVRVTDEYFPRQNPHSGGTIYQWTIGEKRSAHQAAKKFGHQDVLDLLMERSPAELRLASACAVGDRAIVETLRAQQPDLGKHLTGADRAQIRYAAEDNNVEGVRLMLECGWPLDGRPETPLHWACWHGNLEMARAILAFHPPLEALDENYHAPPMGWACHGSENGWHKKTGDYAGVVEALLHAGAKPPERLDGSMAVQEVLRRHGVRS